MKKKKVFKNGSKIYAKSADKDFSLVIRESLERGESLEQLSERIGEDTVPNFYGAQFRAAYNEGIEQGSAYGFEQPLDLHDAMINAMFNAGAGIISMDFNKEEPITVEAEFEVVKSIIPIDIEKIHYVRNDFGIITYYDEQNNLLCDEKQMMEFIMNASPFQASEIIESINRKVVKKNTPFLTDKQGKTGATFICEVQAIGGKRCVVQCDTCRNNEGQLVGAAKDPGEDIIQTPLGEMTVRKWDLHNIGYQHLTNEENAKLFGWAVKDPEQWKEHNLVTPEDYQKLLLGSWKSEPNNETDKK